MLQNRALYSDYRKGTAELEELKKRAAEAEKEGDYLRFRFAQLEDARLQAQEHMLAAYPSLQKMYQPGDGNTQIFALENGTATFSSFTEAPRTVHF